MRVLVTRPRGPAEGTAARLRASGHAPLVAPLLEIRLTGAAPPAGAFAAAILTSANAVPALTAHASGLAAGEIFAVGERTASLAREAGLGRVRDVAGEGGNAAALARRVIAAVEPGTALLLVAGRDRKPEPQASLAAAGFRVAVWEAYAARRVAALPANLREALRSGELDAALHYSRRSAEAALDLADRAGLLAPFLALAHRALSDDVAEPLAARGAALVAVAEQADEAALLATLGPGRSRPPTPRC